MNTTATAEMTFTAWGRTWTRTEAEDKLDWIAAENDAWGYSDERVTLAATLEDGLEGLETRKLAAEEQAKRTQNRVEARSLRLELARIKEYRHLEDQHDRIIDAADADWNRIKRSYRTRSGWLRGQVRILDAGGTIIFAG